jgi:hypothetical protein
MVLAHTAWLEPAMLDDARDLCVRAFGKTTGSTRGAAATR